MTINLSKKQHKKDDDDDEPDGEREGLKPWSNKGLKLIFDPHKLIICFIIVLFIILFKYLKKGHIR